MSFIERYDFLTTPRQCACACDGCREESYKEGKKGREKNERCEVEKTEKGIKEEWKCGNKIFNL